MTVSPTHQRKLLYFLFAISGFSGLIYEAIWSHYLKLFLGHAAYAQTLVLAIFMGGMAIGSWLASRYSTRWKNLLTAYAFIEGVIGLCAVIFHGVFVSATDMAYDTVIPAMGSPWSVNLFKWSLASILILPQSILLGATFPLMSTAVIRRFPDHSGGSLSMLYFANSIGAAIGVLVSGFVLVELVGLPGTILTAGLINIVLALFVYLLAQDRTERPIVAATRASALGSRTSWRLLLVTAFLTGAASFMYEIGWIRMLSLVLGSSTHSFELMLSAFIFGLAFGGLWIRRRIDGLKEPVCFLGWVQIAMGALALSTLVAYNASFDVMRAIMYALLPSENGYRLFNLGSHAIALAVMIPATFCAGMTLPLITHVLLRQRQGEKSIGAVYAANTVGAIFGVVFATHIGLPLTGIKGLVTTGAAVDMALGVWLLYWGFSKKHRWPVMAAGTAVCTVLALVLVGVHLDRYKMASGVYRAGSLFNADSAEIFYHRDGKTATVSLLKDSAGLVAIRTNGKPDAAIVLSDDARPSPDESTMIMAAAIPLAHNPNARTAANIGMGSGLTAHALLGSPNLERVDTIEIEPAMIEAAKGFGARVERAYVDPRSHIFIDDAKTFFSANAKQYDIIVSEPSNPWVSGVSSLFSDEFYTRVRRHLAPGGLFLQWFQLYEIDINLVGSVMKAIDRNFPDYAVYAPNDSDLMIVARADGPLPPAGMHMLGYPGLQKDLRRVGIVTPRDFALRSIGNRKLLRPMFASLAVPANSDYFPFLDLNAVRARFMRSDAIDLPWLGVAPLPILEMLGNVELPRGDAGAASNYQRSVRMQTARILLDVYRSGGTVSAVSEETDNDFLRRTMLSLQLGRNCRGAGAVQLWLENVLKIASAALPHVSRQDARVFSNQWRSSDCYSRLSLSQTRLLGLYEATGQRDAKRMSQLSELLLKTDMATNDDLGRYLLGAGMLGYLTLERPADAYRLWQSHAFKILGNARPSLPLLLLLTHSAAGRAS